MACRERFTPAQYFTPIQNRISWYVRSAIERSCGPRLGGAFYRGRVCEFVITDCVGQAANVGTAMQRPPCVA